jgi:hypothetical protein
VDFGVVQMLDMICRRDVVELAPCLQCASGTLDRRSDDAIVGMAMDVCDSDRHRVERDRTDDSGTLRRSGTVAREPWFRA